MSHVVYVHGLWLSGRESHFLRRRLAAELGAEVRAFSYPSRAATMHNITEQLADFVAALNARELHFVGHSLGGLVIYRFLERFTQQPPGRVVFPGTPSVASRAAQRIAELRWPVPLLGRTVAAELFTPQPRHWTHADRPLGVISGTRPMGLGRFFARFDEENDGTVAVSETRLPGLVDARSFPVSHMGMLLSARVAAHTAQFLRHGSFAL